MITLVSLFDEEKKVTYATCVISATDDAIVPEIEAILSSTYKERPNEFLKALDVMMERIKTDAKNNISN